MVRIRPIAVTGVLCLALGLAAMAPVGPAAAAGSLCGSMAGTTPHITKVLWITMENVSYGGASNQIPGTTNSPYIDHTVLPQCGSNSNFHATTHPSYPNYLAMTSGSTHGVADDNLRYVTGPSLFSQVDPSWRAYNEYMPTNCDHVGQTGSNPPSQYYAGRHNPAVSYSDLPVGAPSAGDCATNDVPLGSPTSGALAQDAAAGSFPAFSFVSPGLCNDMHPLPAGDTSCPNLIKSGDAWLATWIPILTSSPDYTNGNLLIDVVWDEGRGGTNGADCTQSTSTDCITPNLVISPYTTAFVSTANVDQYSLLKTTEEILGVPLLGGAADPATTDMCGDFGICAATAGPPGQPGPLTATANGSAAVDLQWGAAVGATSYDVRRGPVGTGTYPQDLGATAATNFSDTGLNPGDSFDYEVVPSNPNGAGPPSNAATGTTVPAQVTGLSAIATASGTEVDLQWTAAPGATGYQVERSPAGTQNWAVVEAIGSTTSYSDQSVLPGMTYDYRVSALDAGGRGAVSATVTVTTPGTANTALLSNGFDGGTMGATITAANSGGASGNGFNTASCASGTLTYSAPPAHGSLSARLTPGTGTCFVAWTAKAIASASEGYGRAYVNLSALPPGVTALLKVMSPGGTRDVQVNLSKTGKLTILDANGATQATFASSIPLGQWVRLEWHLVAGSAGSFGLQMYSGDSTTAVESQTVAGINAGPAIGGAQVGALSSLAAGYGAALGLDDIAYGTSGPLGPAGGGGQDPPGPVTGVSANAPLPHEVDLSWNATAGATSYEVDRSTTSLGGYSPVATGLSSPSFADTSVAAATAYQYIVVASNSAGPGQPSDPVAVTTPSAPAALLENGFEGGSNGSTLTAANSGGLSGNALNTVSCATGTARYSTASAAHGGVSALLSPTTAPCLFGWTGSSIPTAAEGYGRAELNFSANPSGTIALLKYLGPGSVRDMQVNLSKTGKLSIVDASGVTKATFATSIPIGQWVRLEWHAVAGSTGSVELRMYLADATTPIESHVASGLNVGTSISALQVGALSSLPAGLGAVIGIDDLAYGTSWLGPPG